jgi:transcriptional regulator with XRE-family HTH domain
MKWNEQLKQERNLQGWTQTLLAKKLGTNTYTVSRWERGTAFPSLFYRQQLSRLFGKSLEQLGLIPELDNRRTQYRHTAEPKTANVQQAEKIAELETANIQQAEHIAEPDQHRHEAKLETVSVQRSAFSSASSNASSSASASPSLNVVWEPDALTAHKAELDTNLHSESPFSDEGQRGEATYTEFVPRNASWYETVGVQSAAPVAELQTVSVQQTHAAKTESCSIQRKWTPLDLEYESNKEDAIKALFMSSAENHSKLLAEKLLPKESNKSFPSLNLSHLWLAIILSGIISLATILSLHALMPSSLSSQNAGGVCLAATHPSSLPKAVEANVNYAAKAQVNAYDAITLANILADGIKVSSHSFLSFLL